MSDHLDAMIERNKRLAESLAAGRSPLDDQIMWMLRSQVAAGFDIPGPRVGQLLARLDEVEGRLRALRDAVVPSFPSSKTGNIVADVARYALGEPVEVSTSGRRQSWVARVDVERLQGIEQRAREARDCPGDILPGDLGMMQRARRATAREILGET